jgi:chemotaxis protein methyltransferase CheR
MATLDLGSMAARRDISALATDFDAFALGNAVCGSRPVSERAAIPVAIHGPLREAARGIFEIGDAPRALVHSGEVNLIAGWPMRRCFDVVICRNVAISFDGRTPETLWRRFAGVLAACGHLLIGYSVRIPEPARHGFKNIGVAT